MKVKKEKDNLEQKIKKSLNKVRKGLQADGGDIEFVSFNESEGLLAVKLVGMCACCPMSQMTLKNNVEVFIKKEVPAVKEVIGV
jgi:Fe-S cluster biogenesis protein NfuA